MTRVLVVLGLGMAASAFAAAPFAAPSAQSLDEHVQAARERPMPERLVAVSDAFVGAPYVLSPLGEGAPPDADPRWRFDAFDCTTFVETTLALSRAGSVREARTVLDEIRYKEGRPAFEARRHFPEAEWLPELIGLGYLEDITQKVAGPSAKRVQKILSHDSWQRRKKPILSELPPERIPTGTHQLWVWPIDEAVAHPHRIPPGTVLSVVRDDYRSIPVRVSHQGLVIKKGRTLYMRHAADRVFHRVVDEPLKNFLTRIQRYQKWPVTGIHLAKVLDDQGPAAPRDARRASPPSTTKVQ